MITLKLTCFSRIMQLVFVTIRTWEFDGTFGHNLTCYLFLKFSQQSSLTGIIILLFLNKNIFNLCCSYKDILHILNQSQQIFYNHIFQGFSSYWPILGKMYSNVFFIMYSKTLPLKSWKLLMGFQKCQVFLMKFRNMFIKKKYLFTLIKNSITL